MEKTNYFSNIVQTDTLSYTFVNDEHINGDDLRKTNIISCTIQNSTFTEVNFHSSDFDGTILIHCNFIQGDWSRTDCCSLTASNTIFDGIDFTLSTMRDCDFKQCTFIRCKFDHIALSTSNFEKCEFKDIHIMESSTYLNTYENCFFEKCEISGNFYYNLLIHNTYIESSFNNKLFAYNYFLLKNNKNWEVFKLDDVQKEELTTYLVQHKLLINRVILRLNENNNMDISIIQFIVAIGEILKMGIVVRDEQLQFMHKILQFFLKNNMISAVTIAETLSCLEKHLQYFDTQQNTAYEKCKNTLNFIKNELYQVYQTMGQSISYVHNAEEVDTMQMVKIIYEQEPQIPICSILNEIKTSLGIDAPDAVRVKTEVGSFYEWISCYDSIIQCLELFIAVLGLGYTLVSDYQKKASKKNEKLVEKADLEDTNSEQMIAIINKALSKPKINPEFSQTIQVVVKNDIIATKNFRGYSRSNVQSVEIITKNN